jgi:hypothetical protein
MKTTANYATYPAPGRLESLRLSINSIINQVDLIRICFNSYESIPPEFDHPKFECIIPDHDLTDLGKFHWLFKITEHERYFTCDDDIIYPPDYISHTIRHEHLAPVISYHGRIINPLGNPKSYYRGGHVCYSFLDSHPAPLQIHVPGTGVMMINTMEAEIDRLPDQPLCMADLVFANACQSEIFLIPHAGRWLKNNYVHGCITSRFTNKSADESEHLIQVKKLILKFGL